jgi:hypothetical protein
MPTMNYGRALQVLLATFAQTLALAASAQSPRAGSEELFVDLPDRVGCDQALQVAFDESAPVVQRYQAARQARVCIARARAAQSGSSEAKARLATDPALVAQALAAAEEEVKPAAQFLGLNFGVGIGVSYSQDERISEAAIAADGTIRAVKTQTQEPRVILESHYYGWCRSTACEKGRRGIGPFFGIVAKDDKLISAFAAGVMLGWKDDAPTSAGFSVGIGALLDSDVRSLAKGFETGKPLPVGETEVRYEDKSRWGALLFFTRTF